MAAQPYLSVKGLRKHYGSGDTLTQVLKGITADVMRGETCVLLGPSGSGKSTFLNLIGGLEPADGGSIRVGGTELTDLSDRDLVEYRRRELGFVFQFYNLVPNLTVTENIEVCEYLTDDPMPLEELLDTLGLSEHRLKFPSQLSGGQQQRCAIARALVKQPQVLLCDEPTGALDYGTSKEMLALLQQVNERLGTTIVIVTHNEAISRMTQRTIMVRDGRVQSSSVNDAPVRAEDLSW